MNPQSPSQSGRSSHNSSVTEMTESASRGPSSRTRLSSTPSYRTGHSTHEGKLSCGKCRRFYHKYVSSVDKEKLQDMTKDQSQSQLWMDSRKLRITASTAKKVPKTKKTDPSKFLSQHIQQFNGSAESRDKEAQALSVLSSVLGTDIKPSGTVCHPIEPWLSASPDGVIVTHREDNTTTTTVVEVKCPLVATTLRDEVCTRGAGGLEYDPSNRSDPYSLEQFGNKSQVQLTMHCVGARSCQYFVFSTPSDHILIDVDYDETFVQNLVGVLKKFYFRTMLPALVDKTESGELEIGGTYLSLCSQPQTQ